VQALVGHLVGAARHRIVHDVQQAFDIAGRVRAVLLAHAQAPGDGAAHGSQVQALPFDGCRRHGLLAPGLRRQFQTLFEAERGQLAFDRALGASSAGQGGSDGARVVVKRRPSRLLPDVGRVLGHGLGDLTAWQIRLES